MKRDPRPRFLLSGGAPSPPPQVSRRRQCRSGFFFSMGRALHLHPRFLDSVTADEVLSSPWAWGEPFTSTPDVQTTSLPAGRLFTMGGPLHLRPRFPDSVIAGQDFSSPWGEPFTSIPDFQRLTSPPNLCSFHLQTSNPVPN